MRKLLGDNGCDHDLHCGDDFLGVAYIKTYTPTVTERQRR